MNDSHNVRYQHLLFFHIGGSFYPGHWNVDRPVSGFLWLPAFSDREFHFPD